MWKKMKHTYFTWKAKRMTHQKGEPPFSPLKKPLDTCRVALITTAGVLVKGEKEFDTENGDPSYRIIPRDVSIQHLTISHTHYDTSEALQDINVIFPLERLREWAEMKKIGSVADYHYGFMGYIPDPSPLIAGTAIEVADRLVKDQVDVVILTPG